MTYDKEIWLDVEESNYQISNFGNIRWKYKQKDKYKPVNGTLSRHGYLNLHLRRPRSKHIYIHKFVAHHFINPVPDGFVVHHKDEDKLNNHVSNLEIVTHAEHRKRHKNSNKPQLTLAEARIIRGLYYTACKSMSDICRIYHYVSPSILLRIKNCIDGYYEDFDDPIYDAVYYADKPHIVNTYDGGRIQKWRHGL